MPQPPPPPRRSNPDLAPERESIHPPAPQRDPRGTGVSVRERARESSPPPEPPAGVYTAEDFEHSVHLDSHGNILAGNGKLEELASLAAFACRLSSLVGQQLSFGDVTGMEVTLATGVFMLHRDNQGEVVGVKPHPHLNLVQLRAQLNL
jgi:hypothetical protein